MGIIVPFGASCKSTPTEQGSPAPGPSPAANAATAAAAPTAAPAPPDYSEITGPWGFISEWGQVSMNGNVGTYTDTFGPGPGRLVFTKTGDHTYDVVWSESPKRHGTMALTAGDDGRKLTGTWTPDANVTIGGKTGGAIYWRRR